MVEKWQILRYIREVGARGRAVSAREIADRFGLSPKAASMRLLRYHKQGLLGRKKAKGLFGGKTETRLYYLRPKGAIRERYLTHEGQPEPAATAARPKPTRKTAARPITEPPQHPRLFYRPDGLVNVVLGERTLASGLPLVDKDGGVLNLVRRGNGPWEIEYLANPQGEHLKNSKPEREEKGREKSVPQPEKEVEPRVEVKPENQIKIEGDLAKEIVEALKPALKRLTEKNGEESEPRKDLIEWVEDADTRRREACLIPLPHDIGLLPKPREAASFTRLFDVLGLGEFLGLNTSRRRRN
ncbi:MAG: hypothetical protein HWN68_15500 [Desulfobacterales bacterium]|nr:hypothetical protein [Desulfobacterales bacterium]